MTNSRCLIIITICLLLTVLPGQPTKPASAAEDNDNTKEILIQHQKKIKRLNQGIEEQTERITETKKKEGNLLSELDAIDERLQEENRQLYTLKSLLKEKELSLRDSEIEVSQVIEEKLRRQIPAKERLIAYYRVGDIGIMNLLFSASSLPDLINLKEYFHRVVQHDQKIMEGYRQTINRLREANSDRQHKNILLTKTIDDISAQQQKLAITRAQRITLLNRVKTEKKLYNRAVEEMREAANDLNATINKLKKDASQEPGQAKKLYPDLQSPKKRKPQNSQAQPVEGFPAQKGQLPPPVGGTVKTKFGRNITAKFGITTIQNGIDITTNPGANVQAIYDGSVAFAGALRGYGNMVIIDHGGQYYSLSSQIPHLHAEEGMKVKQGQTIGTMGNNKELPEELHFEIRYGTVPQDPLVWLDSSKLKHKASSTEP